METIVLARKRAKMTQEQLASEIGVQRAVISKYENGTIEPSLTQIKRIAKALNTTVAFLLGADSNPEPSFSSSAFELAMAEYENSGTTAKGELRISERIENLRQNAHHRKIKSVEEIAKEVADAEQEHMDILKSLCFDPLVLEDDYADRIRYVTSYIEKNAEFLKLGMPGTQLAPDDIEEAKKIRASKHSQNDSN